MRMIDADALIPSEVHTIVVRKADGKEVWESVLYAEQIDNAPTVDTEPIRHGHWIMKPNGHGTCSNCNNCSLDILGGVDCNYCPNCGAKMDEMEK